MELKEILAARDLRAQRQKELLAAYRLPLLSFTMNIPGPTKNSPLITEGFHMGTQAIEAQFPNIRHFEEKISPAGCEAFYVISDSAEKIKALCIQIEQEHPIGRLFDLDVLTPEGEKLSRSSPRPCLLCNEDARICARKRSHSPQALFDKITELLTKAMQEQEAEALGALAVQSLLYELCTTPKPGLVDLENNGIHKDMDCFTFCRSAASLGGYFRSCAAIGIRTRDLSHKEVLSRLRYEGRAAEQTMYLATKGVNTHKGAIFSLGLLCAAAGRTGKPYSPKKICKESSLLCKGLVQKELASLTAAQAQTKGEALYLRHGIGGARAQAEEGFPTVLTIGLPVLRKGIALGYDLHRAGAGALLAMLCKEPDTCLLSRSSPEQWQSLRAELSERLKAEPYPSAEALRALDQRFTAEKLSPGGCADLLALCHFLFSLESEAEE